MKGNLQGSPSFVWHWPENEEQCWPVTIIILPLALTFWTTLSTVSEVCVLPILIHLRGAPDSCVWIYVSAMVVASPSINEWKLAGNSFSCLALTWRLSLMMFYFIERQINIRPPILIRPPLPSPLVEVQKNDEKRMHFTYNISLWQCVCSWFYKHFYWAFGEEC